jgi:drug/metabolite transporter (DMT)-like permease
MKKENLGYLQIIIASFLFGAIPIIVRFGNNLGAYNLSFFRVLAASFFLLIFFLFSKKKLAPLKYERGKLIFFGAIHGFIILGYFLAIQFLSVASAVLLLYSSSIWIILFSHFILKEKITSTTWLALFISIIGVVLVLSPQNFFVKESLIGSVAGLLAGVGMGIVYVLSKTFKKYDKVSLTFWQNLIAIPFVLPLVFIDPPKFTPIDIGIILILGSFLTVIPFILLFKGFQKVQAQKGGVIILLDLVISIFLALIIFEEIPSTLSIIGGILIILGTVIITIKK